MAGIMTAFGLRRRATMEERLIAFLVQWALLSVSVWVAAELVAGIHWQGWKSIAAVALVLGLLNVFIRPILFRISLPLTVITFGLFVFVLNALMLWLADRLAAHWSAVHFHIDHFLWDAIGGALIITLV